MNSPIDILDNSLDERESVICFVPNEQEVALATEASRSRVFQTQGARGSRIVYCVCHCGRAAKSTVVHPVLDSMSTVLL